MKLKSARKVAEELNCDHSTIDNILNINKIPRFSFAEQIGRTMYLRKDGQEF